METGVFWLLVVVLASSAFLLGWLGKTIAVRRPPVATANPVESAVRRAFLSVGLPEEQFRPDFNLLKAGKLEQVYHLSARELGVDPEFDTVGDVIRWLKE